MGGTTTEALPACICPILHEVMEDPVVCADGREQSHARSFSTPIPCPFLTRHSRSRRADLSGVPGPQRHGPGCHGRTIAKASRQRLLRLLTAARSPRSSWACVRRLV